MRNGRAHLRAVAGRKGNRVERERRHGQPGASHLSREEGSQRRIPGREGQCLRRKGIGRVAAGRGAAVAVPLQVRRHAAEAGRQHRRPQLRPLDGQGGIVKRSRERGRNLGRVNGGAQGVGRATVRVLAPPDEVLVDVGDAVAQGEPHPGVPVGAVGQAAVESPDRAQLGGPRHDRGAGDAVDRRAEAEELGSRVELTRRLLAAELADDRAGLVQQLHGRVGESRCCAADGGHLQLQVGRLHHVVGRKRDEQRCAGLGQRPVEAAVVAQVTVVRRV